MTRLEAKRAALLVASLEEIEAVEESNKTTEPIDAAWAGIRCFEFSSGQFNANGDQEGEMKSMYLDLQTGLIVLRAIRAVVTDELIKLGVEP